MPIQTNFISATRNSSQKCRNFTLFALSYRQGVFSQERWWDSIDNKFLYSKQSNWRKRKEKERKKIHTRNTSGITWDANKQQFHLHYFSRDLGFYQTRQEAIEAKAAFIARRKNKSHT